MAFPSYNEVDQRLTQNEAPLTDAEIRDLYPWMQTMSTGAARRLNAELSLRNITTLRDFDKNSGRVAWISFGLNLAMLVLTVVAVWIAVASYRAASRSSDQQQATLDASRRALEQVLTTAGAQQRLLQESVETANKELAIIRQHQLIEMQQPDVHLALYYTDELSVAVSNSGKKVARDALYQGLFWNLSRPRSGAFQFVSTKGDEVKYIRPGGGFAPTVLQWHYGNDSAPPKDGDMLFGYMTIQCPDCIRERLYWVYFAVGGDGIYREGKWEEFSFQAKDAITSASRLAKSQGLIRLNRGNLLH